MPLFFSHVIYQKKLLLKKPYTLRKLCEIGGVQCKATGKWTERLIEVIQGSEIKIFAEPGDWGSIKIEVNYNTIQSRARHALAILAYVFNDLVAKQSIQGEPWTKIELPVGRRKTGKALSNKERQERFRQRQVESKVASRQQSYY